MLSKRRTATAQLHGAALVAAQLPEIETIAARLFTGVDPDLLSEAGGVMAGAWFASPTVHLGHELIAAGLLLSGQIDHSTLVGWVNVGADRTRRAWVPYHPGNKP